MAKSKTGCGGMKKRCNNGIKDISRLSEEDCERICKNIACALQTKELSYYESLEWIEIGYGVECIALRWNSPEKKEKFKILLKDAIAWLINKKHISRFCYEQAMVNIDVAG